MRPVALLIVPLPGCSHSDAFVGAAPPLAEEPFAPGSPTRLTYDPGMDLFPSWTLRGRGLLTLPNVVGTVGFTRIGQTAWLGEDEILFVAQDYRMLGNIANGNKKFGSACSCP